MKSIEIISQDVFDKVRSRFQNMEMGDETGAVTVDPTQARFFDFDFVNEGVNLGRVSISLNDAGSLKIYYSQGITENQDDLAKKLWYSFLREMRLFAMRRLLRFDTRDIAKTNLDKNDFQHLAKTQGLKKEEDMTTMNESRWNHKSSKKTSRAVKGQTEVIVRHANPVNPERSASRSQRKNIKAIFIQNRDGERFKYPFIHTAGAFAMAQHVDHGGVPHDPAGKAIIKMSEDLAQLAEFHKKIRLSELHADANGITERATARMNELKATMEALGKRHHYEAWMENFQEPMDDGLEMDEVTMEEYKQKFTQTNFQEELAGYFPLLHRIMKETNKLDLEEYVEEGRDQIGGAGVAYQAGVEDGRRAKSTGVNPEVNVAAWGKYISDYRRGMHDAFNLPAKGPESQFEEWAEAVEQNKLSDNQITLLKQAIDNQQSSGNPLQLGPNGSDAWDFFSNAINPSDSAISQGPEFSDDLQKEFEKFADHPEMDAMEIFTDWTQKNYPELAVALGLSGTEAPAEQPAPAQSQEQPVAEAPEDRDSYKVAKILFDRGVRYTSGKGNEIVDMIPDALREMGFSRKTIQTYMGYDEDFISDTIGELIDMEKSQGMNENQDQDGIPKQMSRESVVKEVAKLVMSRFNRDNESVGPFNGKNNIALDIKKECAEMFGEEVGDQCEQLAMEFMEKLSKKWEAEHGHVEDDGLARLKELLGNVKEKVESIGDTTNNGHAPGNNIMQDEGAFKNADAGIKQPLKVPGQKGALPDVMKKGEVVKSLDKSKSFFGKTFEELDDIRKLSGLAK